jgi:predicted enzyme related to lactoylglutathione lyase
VVDARLTAPNIEAARAFYETLFGWETTEKLDKRGPKVLQFELDGTLMATGVQASEEELNAKVRARWTEQVAFAVESADAAVATALELGAATALAPMDTPAGRVAILEDPQGARFSVVSSR